MVVVIIAPPFGTTLRVSQPVEEFWVQELVPHSLLQDSTKAFCVGFLGVMKIRRTLYLRAQAWPHTRSVCAKLLTKQR
jgi:hypothetical protein